MKKLSNKKKMELLKEKFNVFATIRYEYDVERALGNPSDKMIADYENAMTDWMCWCHILINGFDIDMGYLGEK